MDKQLLIVDDCPILVELLSEIFSIEGYEIIAAYDGQEAIDVISETIPDIAILDVNMPLISGYEVLNYLRSQADGYHTKVFLLTGDYRVYRDAYANLADSVLSKPFDLDELLHQIASMDI